MSLTKKNIQKCFSPPEEGASPLTTKDKKEKKKVIERICDRLKNLKEVRLEVDPYGASEGIELRVKFFDDWYDVLFNSEGILEISDWKNSAPFYDEEQIVTYFHAVEKEQEKKKIEAIKRKKSAIKKEKILSLKEKTIETNVKLLAKKFQLTYSLEQMSTKMKLIIRLDRDNALFIDIPYAKFQEVLSQLEEFIQTSLAFYQNGLKFTVRSTYKVRGWIEPEEEH